MFSAKGVLPRKHVTLLMGPCACAQMFEVTVLGILSHVRIYFEIYTVQDVVLPKLTCHTMSLGR